MSIIDNFYYFDKSAKRKNELAEYCYFCDVEYRKILKHANTRWLSLEQAVIRIYAALKSHLSSGGTFSIP